MDKIHLSNWIVRNGHVSPATFVYICIPNLVQNSILDS